VLVPHVDVILVTAGSITAILTILVNIADDAHRASGSPPIS
jgi:hypothetical protein